MATVKLKSVKIVGKDTDLDGVATVLGRSGVFQPDDARGRPDALTTWDGFSGVNPFMEPLQKLRDVAEKNGKKLTLLDEKESRESTMSPEDAIEYAETAADELLDKSARIAALEKELKSYSDGLADIENFVGHDIDLSTLKTYNHVDAVFGYLPEKSMASYHLYESKIKLHFNLIKKDGDKNWGFYLIPKEGEDEVRRIYKVLKFHVIPIDHPEGKPENIRAELKSNLDLKTSELAAAKTDFESFWGAESKRMQTAYTLLTEKNVFYNAICKNAAVFNGGFVIVGWIPSTAEKQLVADLQQYELTTIEFEGGKSVEKYNPPTMLHTPALFRPYEMYTKMFGVPGKLDVAPTILTGIVYPILFGIMFGDVGQGAVIGIFAFILYKKGKLPVGSILVSCCVCAVIFGFFYGSVFGVETWLNPIHQLMHIDFNAHAGKFVEVMDAHTSPYIIYFTMGLGVIIMTICMIINIINKFAKGHAGEAVFGTAGIAGLAFYLGLAGVLANLIVGDLCAFIGFNAFTLPWLLGMCAAPLVLIFFREPLGTLIEGKGIHFEDGFGNYCLQNIFELIEVAISTMSNVMSFLRVGAFVLVHAGMMTVVFSLADTFGGGNIIIYIIIAVIGNALIAVLECLLVCIQVLRLNYYEMYNRFYVGDGREYVPVNVRTMAA